MNTRSIAGTVVAALMTFAMASPATVLASDRHHGHQDRGHNSGHSDRHRGGHHYERTRKHRYDRHNYGHGGHTTNYYRKDRSHEKLLIGLVVGGVLGYALNNAQHRNGVSYDRYPSRQSNDYPVNDSSYRHNDNSCLQEREYQTTVIVGGREVDAYGTACLQPDGSWKRRPAQLASY